MALTAAEIRKVYAIGARLGLVESNNKNDALHDLVSGITGKISVKQLTAEEYKAVMSELITRMKISQLEPPPEKQPKRQSNRKYEAIPGKMSAGQQKKVWALMYQLQKADTTPSIASLGERLSGIINKQFGIDATEKSPMKWLTTEQGNKLIETIKRYIRSAEGRVKKPG